jgi:hypothetical protein
MLNEKQVLAIVPVTVRDALADGEDRLVSARKLYQPEPEGPVRGRDHRVAKEGQWTRSWAPPDPSKSRNQ